MYVFNNSHAQSLAVTGKCIELVIIQSSVRLQNVMTLLQTEDWKVGRAVLL